MAISVKKTEHCGAKNGDKRFTRAEAKVGSRKRRRQASRRLERQAR